MRITEILTELGPGGAERVVADCVQEFVRSGHACTVISLRGMPDEKRIVSLIENNGGQIVFLDCSKRNPVALCRRLKSAIIKSRPDIVHAHLVHPNLLSRFSMPDATVPLVNTVHIAEKRFGRLPYFLADRATVARVDAYTAVSAAAARYHEKRCRFPQNLIQVIYNGVDPVTPPSPEVCAQLRAKWFPEKVSGVIGLIGRLAGQKGYDRLLDSVGAISARIPTGDCWGIVILGEGEERARLENKAQECQARFPNIQIALPGFTPDAASFAAAFDVFAMVSRYEGYGLALAEAICLGLPVVCTAVDSLPELCALYHGNAIQIPDTPPETFREALADALARAMTLHPTAGQVLWTKQAMAQAYLSLYERIIREKKGNGASAVSSQTQM